MELKLQNYAASTVNDSSSRLMALAEIDTFIDQICLWPDLCYRILRNLCQEGLHAQNAIASFQIIFTESSSRFYPQLLNNLCQGNLELQAKVWEASQCFTLTSTQPKFYSALFYSLLMSDSSKTLPFIEVHGSFLREVILMSRTAEDDEFQWYFLLISKVLSGHLSIICSSLAHEVRIELLDLIRQSLEKSWDERICIWDETLKGKVVLTFNDAECLAQQFFNTALDQTECFLLLLGILDFISREGAERPEIQTMLIDQGIPETCWNFLEALDSCKERQELHGTKTSLLHILANTCDRNPRAVDIASRHLPTLLNCTVIDPLHMFTREWAIVIVRYLTTQSPSIQERLSSFKPLDVTQETKDFGIELDPETLRPYYKHNRKA